MDNLDRRSFLGRMLAGAASLPFILSQSKSTPEVAPKADAQSTTPKPQAASSSGEITTYPFDATHLGARTTYCFDKSGQVTTILHPDGRVSKSESDAFRRSDS